MTEFQIVPDDGLVECRLIVGVRGTVLTSVEVAATELRARTSDGLAITLSGRWRITLGSPRVGPEVTDEALLEASGRADLEPLSLVLFDAGSLRLVLSNGFIVTADIDDGTRIQCEDGRGFAWRAGPDGVELESG